MLYSGIGSTTVTAGQNANTGVSDDLVLFNFVTPISLDFGAGSFGTPGSFTITAVPEPSTMTLLGVAGVGFAARRFRKKSTSVKNA